MDQPISPRRYLILLRRRWPLIVAPPIVALAAAVLVSLIMPVAYTATATMIAPKPQLVYRWDNRISDVVDVRFDWRVEVLPLLNTQNLSERALDRVSGQLQQPMTAEALLAATRVRQGSGSLFTISVSAARANDAALLANALADSLSEAVAEYYGGDLTRNKQALALAEAEYQRWDDALLEFRGSTGIGIGFAGDIAARGEDELFGAHSTIKQELVLKNSYRAALQDLGDRIDIVLRAVDEQSPQTSVGLLNVPELVTYGLAYEALRDQATSDRAGLSERLRALSAEVHADLERLAENTIARQYAESEQAQEWENILRVRGIWLESMGALERRDVELQVKQLIEGDRVQIVDAATIPARPSQPNWLLNLGLAVAAGLLLGLLLAVTVVYLSEADSYSQPDRDA